ncbi:MAG: formyltransferase family protein, partial [bacterium]
MKISIVFFGMNHDSLPFFDSLLENKDVDICAVVTNRMDLHMDFILSKKGIKEKLRRFAKCIVRKPILGFIPNRKKRDSTTIESLARHRNIPIFDSALLNEQRIIKKLKNLDTDLFIVGYFNRILRKEIIDIPREGTINIHPSLLPKYGG